MSMTRKLSQCTFAQRSTPLLKTKPQTNQKTNSNPNPKPQPNLKKKKKNYKVQEWCKNLLFFLYTTCVCD